MVQSHHETEQTGGASERGTLESKSRWTKGAYPRTEQGQRRASLQKDIHRSQKKVSTKEGGFKIGSLCFLLLFLPLVFGRSLQFCRLAKNSLPFTSWYASSCPVGAPLARLEARQARLEQYSNYLSLAVKRLVLGERTFPHEGVLKSQTGVLPELDSLLRCA